jgi:hypothetical protein
VFFWLAELFVPTGGWKTLMANNRNVLQDIEQFLYTVDGLPTGFERFPQIIGALSYGIDYS